MRQSVKDDGAARREKLRSSSAQSPHPSIGPSSSVSSNVTEEPTSTSFKPWFSYVFRSRRDAPAEGEGDGKGEEGLFFQDTHVWTLTLIGKHPMY